MHIHFLVEDQSFKKLLCLVLPKIVSPADVSYHVSSYVGIGHIPKKLSAQNYRHETLLGDLPRALTALDNTHSIDAIFILMDLDNFDESKRLIELNLIKQKQIKRLDSSKVQFFFAIEEMEAWLLGDENAIVKAYPKYKKNIFSKYKQDAVCDTWEVLCSVVTKYTSKNFPVYPELGRLKCEWAEKIAVHMRPDLNQSPSFKKFLDELLLLSSNV